MHTVTVRLFAQLREAKGADTLVVDVAPGTTLRSLYTQLFTGPLTALPVAFACNHAAASGTTVVRDGDLIAFLPPVGGG